MPEFSYGELLDILTVINRLIQDPTKRPVKFNMALLTNKRKLEILVADINATIDAATPEFSVIQQAFDALRLKFALQDDTDRPIINTDGKYLVNPSREMAYRHECRALLRENTGWMAIYQQRVDAVNDLKQTKTTEFVPSLVSIEQFPAELSTIDQSALAFMTIELQEPTVNPES